MLAGLLDETRFATKLDEPALDPDEILRAFEIAAKAVEDRHRLGESAGVLQRVHVTFVERERIRRAWSFRGDPMLAVGQKAGEGEERLAPFAVEMADRDAESRRHRPMDFTAEVASDEYRALARRQRGAALFDPLPRDTR